MLSEAFLDERYHEGAPEEDDVDDRFDIWGSFRLCWLPPVMADGGVAHVSR